MRGKLGLALALGTLAACAWIGREGRVVSPEAPAPAIPVASQQEDAAVTTRTETALSRPPIDLVETPGLETATFALG
jgi:hypothetical protein